MEERTRGAWLISHTNKMQVFKSVSDFEDIEIAGKCGLFLSSLSSSDEQNNIDAKKVKEIANLSNINKLELEFVKNKLAENKLIDLAEDGSLSVLGITTSSVLMHTSRIFEEHSPSNFQKAAIELSDTVSDLPKDNLYLGEYISDNYELSKKDTNRLLKMSEEIGFVDFEEIENKKIYFNGNLFKVDVNSNKMSRVLSSLRGDEEKKVLELNDALEQKRCLTLKECYDIVGNPLFDKLQSIGMYDLNEVSNETGSMKLITKPSSFSKYGKPFEEDALDLAKTFVASLYYGMNFRTSDRGKISMLSLLLSKLIAGEEVGPATAIGQDYKLLELKRVIKLRSDKTYPDRYYMKLLKKDVGVLAMQVLEKGDATEQVLLGDLTSVGNEISYTGPEYNRQLTRKTNKVLGNCNIEEILRTLRN